MIAWDKIFQPKKFGGLGFRKTEAVNLAFQCKLAWKFSTQKASDSPVWKSVLRSRSLLTKGLRWTIGTGENISFWRDNWLDNSNLVEILGKDSSMLSDPDCTVSDYSRENLDHTKLQIVLNNNPITHKILGIPIPIIKQEDTYCWGLTDLGTFSTRFATWATHKSFGYKDVAWSFKWIWQLNIMPKIKIFLWQMLHNALPVRGVLVRRGLNIDPACPLCMNDIESNDHLFWECPYIKEVWRLAQQHKWLLLPELQDGPRCSENLLL